MSSNKPVVVYGVSGYTGRLVCEYLREFNVPFLAAGRDKGRVKDVVSKIPGLGERVAGGRRVERFYVATQLPNFLRRPFGSGWALVGDAGCHKDPFLALGVCDAFRDAELLAETVLAGAGL